MKGVIYIEVPDEWLREHVDRLWAKYAAVPEDAEWAGPKPAPQDFLRGRLEEVAQDELRVALFPWPVETSVDVHGMTDEDIEQHGKPVDGLPHHPYGIAVHREALERHRATEHGPRTQELDFETDPEDFTVLGRCPHGVDLDRDFCEHGCRI